MLHPMCFMFIHTELAWLDVNRLSLEEKLCQESKIFYCSTIPLLVHIAHAKLPLPPFLTVPHNGFFPPLPVPPPYGPIIACKCFQYVPTKVKDGSSWFSFTHYILRMQAKLNNRFPCKETRQGKIKYANILWENLS